MAVLRSFSAGCARRLWICLLFLGATWTVAAQAAIPASERAALLNLYASTNGASWASATNWNGPAGTECTWYGVHCDATQSNVIGIVLQGNNLTGSIQSLSGLTALQVPGLPTTPPGRLFGT